MLRHLVKDSAIYAVGTIASRLVGFIMIPVYTRVLTPADYGIIKTIFGNSVLFYLLVALTYFMLFDLAYIPPVVNCALQASLLIDVATLLGCTSHFLFYQSVHAFIVIIHDACICYFFSLRILGFPRN